MEVNLNSPVFKEDLFRRLPRAWPEDLRSRIRERVRESRRKVVILDDDPTGTQTVNGIPVLTGWSVGELRAELSNPLTAFYILTNSRSFPRAVAEAMNREIGRNLIEAAGRADRFVVVSRSDSTLRGHFPAEVEALADGLGVDFDGWIIHPFFLEGGRYTVGDVHYVEERGMLVPAGRTEFARDPAFGYAASNLRHWVEEKTEGRISRRDVVSVSIEDIRQGGPGRVTERLMGLFDRKVCVLNSAGYRDLEVLVVGLLDAEAKGKRFLYRTAASFVQVRAGILPRPLLSSSDLEITDTGGSLIVVGSFVPRTSSQLRELLALSGMTDVEIRVESLLDENRRQGEIDRVVERVQKGLQRGAEVVVYTSRRLVTGRDAEESLSIGNRISEGLIEVLRMISTRPRYLIAKGGITSSDAATRGLGVRRAMVLGQILPGVPVWRLGAESRFPGLPYIVFPGNVGGQGAMAEIVAALGRL